MAVSAVQRRARIVVWSVLASLLVLTVFPFLGGRLLLDWAAVYLGLFVAWMIAAWVVTGRTLRQAGGERRRIGLLPLFRLWFVAPVTAAIVYYYDASGGSPNDLPAWAWPALRIVWMAGFGLFFVGLLVRILNLMSIGREA